LPKNVTITLREEVVRWARIKAAERNTIVFRLLGEILQDARGGRLPLSYEAIFGPEPPTSKESGTALIPGRRSCTSGKVFVDINVLVYGRDAHLCIPKGKRPLGNPLGFATRIIDLANMINIPGGDHWVAN
jgi:hypothetical protein